MHNLVRLSWREAQDLCEGLGGYLAEITSQDLQTFMVIIEGHRA